MKQNLNKYNPSFIGVISNVHKRSQKDFENAKILKILRLHQSNKLQQYIRTMKRWYDPSYLGEFREVTTLTSLLSHQNFFSIKTTTSI